MIGELMARWYENGTKRIPSSEPLYQKIHFSIVLESCRNLNFKRHTYLPIHFEKNKLVLLHYLGDESIAVDYPHGNSNNSIHNYQRTCPSVLQQLRSAPDLPGNIYKKFISENAISTVPPSLLPRNTRQVINLQHNEHQQSRLSHDALYNLHELSLDLSGFVKVIRTHPDLIVVCGLDVILEEMEMVLCTQSTNSQLLSYDTTFQLGDFYVSPFLFRYTLSRHLQSFQQLFLYMRESFKHVTKN